MVVNQPEQLDAIAENLANSATPGYRRLQATSRTFDQMLAEERARVASDDKARYSPIRVDFTPGPIRQTARSLDFAIRGDGFFEVSKDGQPYYTRKGDFQIDNEGRLTTAEGLLVEGAGGPITIPRNIVPGSIAMDERNNLRSGNQTLGTLKVVSFQDNGKLQRIGNTLFAVPTDMQAEEPTDTAVVNGALEGSNAAVSEELVDMITCIRNFESCQRMIRSQDENTGRMIQQIGG
jgi:flagellar basal-body rod protein FlgG